MVISRIIRDVVNNYGYYKIHASGSSMIPTIRDGEEIEVEKADDLKIGDIILFQFCDALVLHRIVEIQFPYIVTRGDNHPYSDHYIKFEHVIAKLKDNRPSPYSIKSYKRKDNDITFIYWNLNELSTELVFQLNSYGINIMNEVIPKDMLNIAIIPGAESNLEYFDKYMKQHTNRKIAIHFNAKISNSEKDGFIGLNHFSAYFRIGHRISNFLLGCEDSMYILLGKLL